ncbi:GIY-YIG nuclease family protein [Erythrobacter sp. W53]|uniref:GIY-YIG nuclease family protein n=1 Tax=Erythrobacter sp. W53 TaxID=3425947 RepID=UPI003D768BDB
MSKLELTKDHILSEIRRLAESDDQPPGIERFTRETGIDRHQWRGVFWTKWSDALSDAGFSANSWNVALATEELLKRYADLCLELDRVPTKAEYKLIRREKTDLPHDETYRKRFGGKAQLIEALRHLAVSDAPYAALLEVLPAEVKQPVQGRANTADGWVYLLKSGAHFKIGRSESVERRIKEISVALPESVSLVHAISTDDPVGIETYWHRRFADQRANGEWFKLGREDVRAFRRRKFQ